MRKRVLIIGGYGNFGRFIARKLAQDANIKLIIAGRDRAKADALCATLEAVNPSESAVLDIENGLERSLSEIAPDIVIHTSGPYQAQSYHVARACIDQGAHYIDLADARVFVTGITALHEAACKKGVFICGGASSVPCLTSAVVDQYKSEFQRLDELDYGIATAQLTNRGLATTRAVLSYAGKPFTTLIDGRMQKVFGWLGLTSRRFWGLNMRLLGNCDIPDLDLFPSRYPELKTIRFRAGLELKLIHIVLWMMSGLVKLRVLPSLQPLSPYLLKISRLFDLFGKDGSGFYMTLKGTGLAGERKQLTFELVARHGDGLYIPSMPSILLAKKIENGEIDAVGAYPCLGFITLAEYLDGLSEFDIQWRFVEDK